MRAVDIEWDIDIDEALEKIHRLLSRIITTFVTWIRALFCSDDSGVKMCF